MPPTDLPRPSPAGLFVYGVFALLLAVGFVIIWQYGRNVPFGEEWLFMPVLTGDRPLTTGWLWEQMYEHRFPLTRAMLAGLFGLGNDLRPGMYFNLLSMAVVAAALVQTARRVRGFTSYADAFFPLVLMHPVHAESCLWTGHLTVTAPAVLCFVLLLVIARGPARLPAGRAALLGLCLLLLPLSGGWGFLAAPPLLLWAAYAAVFVWRGRGGGGFPVLALFGVLTAAVMALYFVGYHQPEGIEASSSFFQVVDVTLQFLSNGFGPGAQKFWPYSGILIAALFAATLGLLLGRGRRGTHRERARALGLLLLVGAVALLAVATGYRRALRIDFAGFQWRYLWTSAPWLCCAYFAWELYGGPTTRQLVPMTLFLLAAFFAGTSTQDALNQAVEFTKPMAQLEEHLEKSSASGGLPVSVVMKTHMKTPADAYYRDLKPQPYLDALSGMKRARVGRFRHLLDDTPYQEVPLPGPPEAAEAVTRERGRWKGTGPESHLVFDLPEPRYVAAVQFTFTLANESGGECVFRVSWRKGPDENAGREVEECVVDARQGVTVTVWVCRVIDGFYVSPDQQPFSLHLRAVKLLLPGG